MVVGVGYGVKVRGGGGGRGGGGCECVGVGGGGEAGVVREGAVGEELHVAGRAELGGGEVLAVELDGEWEGDLFDAGLAVGAGDYGGAGDDGSAGGEGVGVVLG